MANQIIRARLQLKHLLYPEPELCCRNWRISRILEYFLYEAVTGMIHQRLVSFLGAQILKVIIDDALKFLKWGQRIFFLRHAASSSVGSNHNSIIQCVIISILLMEATRTVAVKVKNGRPWMILHKWWMLLEMNGFVKKERKIKERVCCCWFRLALLLCKKPSRGMHQVYTHVHNKLVWYSDSKEWYIIKSLYFGTIIYSPHVFVAWHFIMLSSIHVPGGIMTEYQY